MPPKNTAIPSCCVACYLVYVFFPWTAKLFNYLPVKSFSMTYDLNDFKSRINRLLLSVGCSFQTDLLYALIFVYFFFS